MIFHGPLLPGAAQLQSGGATAYTLTCDAGSFTLTGQNATLTKTSVLSCDAGSFSLTGQDAAFTYTPAPAAPGGGGGWYTEPPEVQRLKRKRRKDREPIPLTEENIPKIAKDAEDDIGALVAAYIYWDDD